MATNAALVSAIANYLETGETKYTFAGGERLRLVPETLVVERERQIGGGMRFAVGVDFATWTYDSEPDPEPSAGYTIERLGEKPNQPNDLSGRWACLWCQTVIRIPDDGNQESAGVTHVGRILGRPWRIKLACPVCERETSYARAPDDLPVAVPENVRRIPVRDGSAR